MNTSRQLPASSAPMSFDDLDTDFEQIETKEEAAEQQPQVYIERCPSCRGSGKFVSYTGRIVGNCFKCGGVGTMAYKQPAEVRAKQRQQAAAKKQASLQDKIHAFAQENPEVFSWISANAMSFDFAASLLESIGKFGSLTERQLAAAQRCADKQKAARAAAAERQNNAQACDVSRIQQAFQAAKANLIARPKLRLDVFLFKPAPDTGRNAGSIYVMQDETYLGKVTDGKFFPSRDCDKETEERVIAAATDPAAAAHAYGQRTGVCSCCGRTLTKAESIARAIGPICAEKFGW